VLFGSLVTSVEVTHPNTASGGSFWNLQNPYAEIQKLLGAYTPTHRFMPVFFRHGQKPVQNKCPKGRIVLATEKKHVLAPFDGSPWLISPKNFM